MCSKGNGALEVSAVLTYKTNKALISHNESTSAWHIHFLFLPLHLSSQYPIILTDLPVQQAEDAPSRPPRRDLTQRILLRQRLGAAIPSPAAAAAIPPAAIHREELQVEEDVRRQR